MSKDLKLFLSICKKDIKEAEKALNDGANPNFMLAPLYPIEVSCLNFAVINQHTEAVALLTKYGALSPKKNIANSKKAVQHDEDSRFNEFIAKNNITLRSVSSDNSNKLCRSEYIPELRSRFKAIKVDDELLSDAYELGYLPFIEKMYELQLDTFGYHANILSTAVFVGNLDVINMILPLEWYKDKYEKKAKTEIIAKAAIAGGKLEILKHFATQLKWESVNEWLSDAHKFYQHHITTYLITYITEDSFRVKHTAYSGVNYGKKKGKHATDLKEIHIDYIKILEYAIRLGDIPLSTRVLAKIPTNGPEQNGFLINLLPIAPNLDVQKFLLKYYNPKYQRETYFGGQKDSHLSAIMRTFSIDLVKYFFFDLKHSIDTSDPEGNNCLMLLFPTTASCSKAWVSDDNLVYEEKRRQEERKQIDFILKFTKVFLESGGDINQVNMKGQTVLFPLIKILKEYGLYFHIEWFNLLEIFLDYGADINVRDNRANSLLLLACEGGFPCEKLLKFLLSKNIVVNHVNNTGDSALSNGLVYGGNEYNLNTVRMLVDADADVNNVNSQGQSILMLVVRSSPRDCFDTVEFLVDRGADIDFINPQGETALEIAARRTRRDKNDSDYSHNYKYNTSVIEFLLSRTSLIDLNAEQSGKILHLFVEYGFVRLIETLLSKEVNVNSVYRGKTPLYVAVEQNHDLGPKVHKVVKLLLDAGADTSIIINDSYRGNLTVLQYAIKSNKDKKLLKLLLDSDLNLEVENSFTEQSTSDVGTFKLLKMHGIKNIRLSSYSDNFEDGLELTAENYKSHYKLELVNSKAKLQEYLGWGFNAADKNYQQLVYRYVTIDTPLVHYDIIRVRGLEGAFNQIYARSLDINNLHSLFEEERWIGKYIEFYHRNIELYKKLGFIGSYGFSSNNQRKVIGNLEKIFGKFIIATVDQDSKEVVSKKLLALNHDIISVIMNFYILDMYDSDLPLPSELDYLQSLCTKYADTTHMLHGEVLDFTIADL